MRFLYFLLPLSCDADKIVVPLDSGFEEVISDLDGDGYLSDEDCDDNNALINPSADELCDGVDNNCNGEVDEEVLNIFYEDLDDDGFGNDNSTLESCQTPEGYVTNGNDCNDENDDIYPSAPEQCDNLDNDCDDEIDEDVVERWYYDADDDGFGNIEDWMDTCLPDEGYVANSDDCDDDADYTYPDAEEICDYEDNDCDNDIDEDVLLTVFLDNDLDGYGDSNSMVNTCELSSGYSMVDGDCDDIDSMINPGANELCDSIDNNCNGQIDEDTAVDANFWFEDFDGDGFGITTNFQISCYQPTGFINDDTDCNDNDATIFPGAIELCDGNINDCNSTSLPAIEVDNDGDRFVDCIIDVNGWDGTNITGGEDCNDSDDTIYPNASELCDGLDNDCDNTLPNNEIDDDGDGFVDCTLDPNGWDGTSISGGEDCDDSNIDHYTVATWYQDNDSDGYGASNSSQSLCVPPAGYIADNTDCDDTDATIYPNAPELCDGQVNSCGGSLPIIELDDDGDGFVECSVDINGWDATPLLSGDDCDDSDATENPSVTWHTDTDGDGYGNAGSPFACERNDISDVIDNSDCVDSDDTIYPSANEICDGLDNDCDAILPTIEIDDDGDGYVDCVLDPNGWDGSPISGGEDCDDSNPNYYNINTWFLDYDFDGYGNPNNSLSTCVPLFGYIADNSDCNDLDNSIYPSAPEICDGQVNTCGGSLPITEIDDDGDGFVECSVDVNGWDGNQISGGNDCDDNDATENPNVTWYTDADGDGYGNSNSTYNCERNDISDVLDDSDCQDTDNTIYPYATELCDGLINDCSSTGLPANETDDDGDGYVECSFDSNGWDGTNTVTDDEDCDDANTSINPGATEVCDGQDNDCDNLIDDNDSSVIGGNTYYLDSDNDGYGSSSTITACSLPSGYATSSNDCDDNNSSVSPGESEICANGVDDNCNGSESEGCSSTYQGCGGPGALQPGSSLSCSFGSHLVHRVRISCGCNDGESGSYQITFSDGSSVSLSAGCGTEMEISPRMVSSATLYMSGGGGGDNNISWTCCGSSGWGVYYY
jgi:large repetitive protein